MRVISFKSRHPIINNEDEREEEGRKSIVDNYDQFQRREKKEKKNPLPIFITV